MILLSLARISMSYWVSLIPDLFGTDRAYVRAVRQLLEVQVTEGASRDLLRSTFGTLTGTYYLLAAPTGLAAALLIGGSSRPLEFLSGWLASICAAEGLYHSVRWLFARTGDEIAVWYPLPADVVIIVATFFVAKSIGSLTT